MIRARFMAAVLMAGLLSSCGLVTSTNRSVFVLFDASGSYAKMAPTAASSANVMIARLQPGDWIGVAQIAACSFSDDQIVAREQLPETPSLADAAKRKLFTTLNTYAVDVKPAKYTDIHGALAQAAYELNQRPASDRFIVVYSDMIEDLGKACDTSKVALDLKGIHVVASNVIKSNPADPAKYFELLKTWEKTVTDAGGQWTIAPGPTDVTRTVSPG